MRRLASPELQCCAQLIQKLRGWELDVTIPVMLTLIEVIKSTSTSYHLTDHHR